MGVESCGTGSEMCSVVGFGTVGVELPGSAVVVLVMLLHHSEMYEFAHSL
jgi:hypothetical protein